MREHVRRHRLSRCLLVTLAALSSIGPASALAGRVVDAQGQPVRGARACYWLAGEDKHCVTTDAAGAFLLDTSFIDTIRITHEGHLPEILPAVERTAPIVLRRTPVLSVKLVDAASGEPLGAGSVYVVYPTGQKKGPFPVNAAGVRITRILEPGAVRVLAEAEGYEPSAGQAATLAAGDVSELVIRLERVARKPG